MNSHNNFKARKRVDYKTPDFTATDIEMTFELGDEVTVVSTNTHYKRLTSDKSAPLLLDGEELTLKKISVDNMACKYQETETGLSIEGVGDDFSVQIENTINPIANTSLMGLYRSNGTYCTQCEPQGFRRITYYLDRPDVLAKFKVKIIAPKFGCGVLLSNGNLIESGKIREREYAVWEDPFPKPSYLFALVAGTFDILNDTYITKSGRKVALSLYVDRGLSERGTWAMASIKEAMKWDEKRFGLEYDLDNFKVVAVDFFNQGAMENKSLNVFNSIYVLVDAKSATDTAFFNVQSVIGHEYFHNYTGDRVTLRDWFELSLKESLTVFRDQEFSSDVASRVLTRLHAVSVIRGPQFAEDAGPMAHPVRPDEVVEMNNFYTVTIYDKGAEVIRMIHTLIGEEKFKAGLKFYLEKFDGKAVAIEDFLCCMEDVSGFDLKQFRLWYSQAGTPKVCACWHYDLEQSKLLLTLSQHTAPTRNQSEKEALYMPVKISFLDLTGSKEVPPELEGLDYVVFSKSKQEYSFSVKQGTIPVLFEDFSAPVKLEAPYSEDDLCKMLSCCDDPFIKADAAVQLQNRYIHENVGSEEYGEPLSLISAQKALINGINDKSDLFIVNECVKVQPLANFIETFDRVDLDGIYAARCALEQKLALALEENYKKIYENVKPLSPKYSIEDMGRRSLNNTALHMLAVALKAKHQEDDASDLVLSHYKNGKTMTEKLAAMTDAVHLSLKCKAEISRCFEKDWSEDALVFDNYFRIIATGVNDGTLDEVRELMKHPCYDSANPNRIRALPGALALSNPMVLNRKDGSGYSFLGEVVRSLDKINPHVAARILTPLLSFRRLDPNRQKLIVAELKKIKSLSGLSRSVSEKVEAALDVK